MKSQNIAVMKTLALAIAKELNIDKRAKFEVNIDIEKKDVRINLTEIDI